MLRKIALAVLLTLAAGCSNLALQCNGTYTGDEVRSVRADK